MKTRFAQLTFFLRHYLLRLFKKMQHMRMELKQYRITGRRLRYHSKRFERHRFIKKLYIFADHVIEVACHRHYAGSNPAIATIYSPLRTSLLVMLALFFVLFVLGSLVPIESAALAKGTIAVLTNKKTVQHLEGGIIRAILVKDGDIVKEGQPLIELSDVGARANQSIVQSELNMAKVTEMRLLALKEEGEEMTLSPDIEAAMQQDAKLTKAVATQKDLFLTQQRARISKLKTLKQRVEEFNEEIKGLEAQVASADSQLELVEQEVEPTQKLVDKGYAAKPQLLALLRHQKELQGNRGQYMASIAKARQSITEAELQITTMENEFASQNAEQLRDAQAKVSDLEEKHRATSDVMHRTIITSPYEGIVTGLKYHTIGGVIAPATPIMDIIPQNERLIVDAQIQPSDIDVVSPGLDTKIVFSAYKTRNLPRINGKVSQVSADVFSNQQNAQLMPYYAVKVEVDSAELAQLGSKLKLTPGMPVEVFIHTGSRSFLAYLFAPITGSLQRAFKED